MTVARIGYLCRYQLQADAFELRRNREIVSLQWQGIIFIVCTHLLTPAYRDPDMYSDRWEHS